jgi:cell division protein FtsQ
MGRMNAAMAYAQAAAADALVRAGFRLEAIDVAGAEVAPFEDIRTALGLEYGDSIFALDLEAARGRVKALDWVGEAQVFRLLPNRIQVVVTEQIPMARWQIGGEILVVDIRGTPIEKAGAHAYPGLPLVVGEGAAEAAPPLLAALEQFPEVGRHVEAAQRVGERRWTLFLASGAQLHLPEREMEAALAILRDLEARRGLLSAPAQSIDLRNPDRIVVQPLPEETSGGSSRSTAGVGPEREA